MSKKSISQGVEKLRALIEKEISGPCKQFDGFKWLVCDTAYLVEHLELGEKAVAKVLKDPSIECVIRMEDGARARHLRVKPLGGKPSVTVVQRRLMKMFESAIPKYNQRIVDQAPAVLEAIDKNIELDMKKIAELKQVLPTKHPKLKFQRDLLKVDNLAKLRELKKLERAKESLGNSWKVSPHEYGCLRGLVEAWGVDQAPMTFSMILSNWGKFMECTKLALADENLIRFYEYPVIPYILCFNQVATEMLIMQQQDAGKLDQLPDELKPLDMLKQS